VNYEDLWRGENTSGGVCAQEWSMANNYEKEVEYRWSWRMSQCSQLVSHEVSNERNVYFERKGAIQER
jgi:hypothetical protein